MKTNKLVTLRARKVPQMKLLEFVIMEEMLEKRRNEIRDGLLAGAEVERGPHRAWLRNGRLVVR